MEGRCAEMQMELLQSIAIQLNKSIELLEMNKEKIGE